MKISPVAAFVYALVLLVALPTTITAQPATLPFPKLYLVSPAGGQAGTTVRVTLNGADLEEAQNLVFSTPALQASPVPDPKNPKGFVTNTFDVTIASNAPIGLHDVRVLGKYGISNPRAFVVGELPEAAEVEPNNDVAQPQKLPINVVINGTIATPVDVDYFSVTATKGQRLTIVCEAESLDSKLDPDVRVFTAANQQLTLSRRYQGRRAVVDLFVPADGAYLVRVCEHAHRTGDAFHYYRLAVTTQPWIDLAYPPVLEVGKIAHVSLYGRNLPGGQSDPKVVLDGKALDKVTLTLASPGENQSQQQLQFSGETLPHLASLDGFECRLRSVQGMSNPVLLTYAAGPVVLDNEDNDTPEKAQALPGPCTVCGRIEKNGDRDWYAFTAQAGEVFILEGYADRLGAPLDLYFVLRRADNKLILGEFDDHPEAVSPLRFYARTDDPKVRFVAPVAGKYELMVSSREAVQSHGPRHVYCLSLRSEQPDFRIVVMDNHVQAPGSCTVWRGGNQYLEVSVFRRDGYVGPITLTAEDLPPGVTCAPQIIPAGVNQGLLVITAAKDAALATNTFTVKATAVINGQPVVREARSACSLWPNPNEGSGIPAASRLMRKLYITVQDSSPFGVELVGSANAQGAIVCPVGGATPFKVKVHRLWPGVATPVTVQALSLPPGAVFNGNNRPVAVAPNVAEAPFTLNLPATTPPGTYTISLLAQSSVPFDKDPKNAKKPSVQVREATVPVKVTVYNRLANVQVYSSSILLKAGGSVELLVRVERLHGYTGPFKVQLVLPQGFAGVAAPEATIPEGSTETRLVLSAPAQAAPASHAGVLVRVTGTAHGVNLASDATVSVTVAK